MSQKVSALPTGVPKIRFSFVNHVLPPLIGIAVSLSMYALLNFPTFEAQARYYYSQIVPNHTTSLNNAASTKVANQQSTIIIPSLSVKAPVIYEQRIDNASFAYALRNGVVHYGTTALPGEKGSVALFGHSSGVAWAPGNYKFVFTLLDKLQPKQQIILDYQGVRYVYIVTGSKVISPSNMDVLKSDGDKSKLLLITCTPVGTSKNRLVVEAKQVQPNPAQNNRPISTENTVNNSLPGN